MMIEKTEGEHNLNSMCGIHMIPVSYVVKNSGLSCLAVNRVTYKDWAHCFYSKILSPIFIQIKGEELETQTF